MRIAAEQEAAQKNHQKKIGVKNVMQNFGLKASVTPTVGNTPRGSAMNPMRDDFINADWGNQQRQGHSFVGNSGNQPARISFQDDPLQKLDRKKNDASKSVNEGLKKAERFSQSAGSSAGGSDNPASNASITMDAILTGVVSSKQRGSGGQSSMDDDTVLQFGRTTSMSKNPGSGSQKLALPRVG